MLYDILYQGTNMTTVNITPPLFHIEINGGWGDIEKLALIITRRRYQLFYCTYVMHVIQTS